MKKIVYFLIVLATIFGVSSSASAQLTTVQGGTGTSSPSGILYGTNGGLHLQTLNVGSGLLFSGTTLSATGGGGSGIGTVATSGLETAGQVAVFGTSSGYPAKIYSQATSTPSAGGPITYSGTFGTLIGGVSGSFGCTTATGSVNGCISSTDWTTFNNKQAAGTYLTVLGNYATTTGTAISFSTTTQTFQGATFGQKIVMSNNAVLFTPNITGTLTAASSTLLANNNTFSGTNVFSGVGPQVVTNASTTNFTTSGSEFFTDQTAYKLLATNANDRVISTSTIADSFLANSSIVVTTASPLGGAGTIPLGGTLALTCSTCSTITTPVSIANGGTGTSTGGVTNGIEVFNSTLTNYPNFTWNNAVACGIGTCGRLTFPDGFQIFSSFNSGSRYIISSSSAQDDYIGTNAGSLTGGYNAGQGGGFDIAFGRGALSAITTGYQNAALGTQALAQLNTGYNDLAVGSLAGNNLTIGHDDIAFGNQTLYVRATSTNYSVAVGSMALTRLNDVGTACDGNQGDAWETAVGTFALQNASIGCNNTAIGASAGNNLTTGNYNVLIGAWPTQLYGPTTGSQNILIGYNIDLPIDTGSDQLDLGNIIFGTGVSGTNTSVAGSIGVSSTTPGSVFSIGTTNGINFSTATSSFSSTGGINLAAGCFAIAGTCIGGSGGSGTVTNVATDATLTGGPITTTGTLGINLTNANSWSAIQTFNASPSIGVNTNGISLGTGVWLYASSTNLDTIMGISAGGNNATTSSTAKGNTIIGNSAGASLTTGGMDTAVGYRAGNSLSTATEDSFFGYEAGWGLGITGTGNNTGIGYISLSSVTTATGMTAIGASTLTNITTSAQGSDDTVVGVQSGSNLQGTDDTSVGFQSLIGGSVAQQHNTAFGFKTGFDITTGYDNLILGEEQNTGGSNITTGGGNILMGYNPLPRSTGDTLFFNVGNSLFGTLAATSSATSLATPIGVSLGVATSTPWGELSVQANNGNTFGLLFEIASSTATATSTLFSVTNAGHIIASSTNPVLSSCGTNPTMKGDDTHGQVTEGSAASTGCVVTFQVPYTVAPICTVSPQSGSITTPFSYTISSTAITVSDSGFSADIFNYICEGLTGS